MPPGIEYIRYIWYFKRKRFLDGRIMKHKSVLCDHGDMQKWYVDYWETYSLVVNWVSVRLLFSLYMINELESISIDYVLAFPQEELKEDVYMQLPYCFDNGGNRKCVMNLNKYIYGMCQSSGNWY